MRVLIDKSGLSVVLFSVLFHFSPKKTMIPSEFSVNRGLFMVLKLFYIAEKLCLQSTNFFKNKVEISLL